MFFENEQSDGCGHCRTYNTFPYKGNCEPCFRNPEMRRLELIEQQKELSARIRAIDAELEKLKNA